ncbi:MAG: zinc-binding dehydrogenase [Pseudomonadota bacterium]
MSQSPNAPLPETMRAAVFHEHGPVENISIETWPVPKPKDGEVLVRMKAVAFNGFDPMILGATTALKTPLPMVPCGDGAGIVAAIGENVSEWSVGDRVSLLPWGDFGMMGETAVGMAREYLTMPADNLFRMPDTLSFEDAAALPIAYGTAYRMMVARGQVAEGETVLILGASGGVGTCCIDLAKSVGATVIATARGAEKCEKLLAHGADHVIDTSKEDLVTRTREIAGRPRVGSDKTGVDVVVNYIGGETWRQCFKITKAGGRILTCGATAGYDPQTDIRYIWSYELNILGSDGWTRQDQIDLMDMCADGRLEPVLHAVRPLEEVRTSMQEMVDRQVFGKSILTL